MTTYKGTRQMPAFLRLPLTALGRPYNYPAPPARPRRMRMNPKPPKTVSRFRLESEPARNSQTHIAKRESELHKP